MKSPVLAVVVCLFLASGVDAQTLTKDEEGRKEVGNCYRMCITDAGGDGDSWTIAWQDQFWANWRDSATWTDEEWTSFLTDWKQTGCAKIQAELLEAYGCRYACFDVEQAYGVTSSAARRVFLRSYKDLMEDLQASGLWVTNDRDYPRPGTGAFNTACENAYDSARELQRLGTRQSAPRGRAGTVATRAKTRRVERPRCAPSFHGEGAHHAHFDAAPCGVARCTGGGASISNEVWGHASALPGRVSSCLKTSISSWVMARDIPEP